MGRGSAQHSVLHLRRQTGDTTGGSTVSSTDSGSSSSTPDSSTPTTTPSSSDPPSTTTTPTSDPPTTTPVSTSATAVTTQVSSSSSSKNSVSSTSTSLSIEKSSTSSVASPTAQSTKQSSTSTSSAAVVSSETSSTAVPLGSSTVYSTTQLSKTKEPSVVTSVAIVSGTDTASLNFASASDSSATVSSSTANPSLGSSEAQTARPLSQQASAGIAIGVLLVLLAIASVVIFTINRRKHRKSQVLDSWMKALEGQQKATVEDHAATLKQSASVKSYRLTEEEKLELQPYRAPYAPPPLPMTEKQSNQLVPDRTSNQEFLTELRAGPYGDPEPTTPSIPLHFGFDDQSKNGVIEHSYDMRSQQSPSPEFTPGDDRELSSVSLNEPTKPRPVHRAERMKKVPPVRWSVQHDHAK